MSDGATQTAKRATRPDCILALGPQRTRWQQDRPQVGAVLDELTGADLGPVAVITAGWEEREEELLELRRVLRRDLVHVAIHGRVEECYRRDPELFAATQRRHDRLRAAHALYRERLNHTAAAMRSLLEQCLRPDAAARSEGASDAWLEELVGNECADAVRAQQQLDHHHLAQVESIWREFEESTQPASRPIVAHHRAEVREILGRSSAVCIAGGHVAILVNRLRLLDIVSGLDGAKVIAWSAGAMALTERLVLFHDTPPQGPGNAEVLEPGLGLLPDVVLLPDAERRLRLEDSVRVAQLAQRFQPSVCIALDPGDGVGWWFDPDETSPALPRAHGAARRLDPCGTVVRLAGPEPGVAGESAEGSRW